MEAVETALVFGGMEAQSRGERAIPVAQPSRPRVKAPSRCASTVAARRRRQPAARTVRYLAGRRSTDNSEEPCFLCLLPPARSMHAGLRLCGATDLVLWRSRPGCEFRSVSLRGSTVGHASRGGMPPEPAGEDARATISPARLNTVTSRAQITVISKTLVLRGPVCNICYRTAPFTIHLNYETLFCSLADSAPGRQRPRQTDALTKCSTPPAHGQRWH